MRGALLVLVLCIAELSLPLKADLHEVVKTTVDGRATVQESFIQGKKVRTEFVEPDGTRFVTIQDTGLQKIYDLDVAAKQYAVHQTAPDLLDSLAIWIRRPARTRDSGKNVNVFLEVTDTGERRSLFGRTAKHFLVRERYVADPGACMRSHEIDKDGWYFAPVPGGSSERGSYLLVAFSAFRGGFECRDRMALHGNSPSLGEPALEVSGAVTRELIGLSNQPLDRGLFELPGGFRQVDALHGQQAISWSEKMHIEFAQLSNAFASWFE